MLANLASMVRYRRNHLYRSATGADRAAEGARIVGEGGGRVWLVPRDWAVAGPIGACRPNLSP